MTEIWQDRSFRRIVYSEISFILASICFALAGAWPMFAALAFMCVLTPLWVIAIAVTALATHKEGEE